jgi:thiol-disulfide isomerase/thioredoxin
MRLIPRFAAPPAVHSILAILPFLAPSLIAADPVAAPSAAADAAWARLDAAVKERAPEEVARQGEAAYRAWTNAQSQRVIDHALAFARAHPADPRVGEAVSQLAQRTMALPPSERAAMGIEALVAETLANPALPRATRGTIMLFDGYASLGGLSLLDDGQERPVDLALARAKLDAFAALFPNSGNSELLEKQYGDRLIRYRPDAVPDHVAWLRQSPHSRWADIAQTLQAKHEVGFKPLDWKFTALDGRSIDLTQLRGKVLLVDFWGTWCGPCRAEIPHIKAVYDRYRAQGFEVIGIACERDGGKALAKFVSEQPLPWITYLDTGRKGKQEGRESFELRFGINAFPTTWLVSKQGLVVARHVRGEAALAAAVQRELEK